MAYNEYGMSRKRKESRLLDNAMQLIFKNITTLLLAISMAMTPVVSVLATTVIDNATYTHDAKVDPCHEMGSVEVVKNKSTQESAIHPCKEGCKDRACQDGSLCSSCTQSAQFSAISTLILLTKHSISDNYHSNHSDGYTGVILSTAFRPPIQ